MVKAMLFGQAAIGTWLIVMAVLARDTIPQEWVGTIQFGEGVLNILTVAFWGMWQIYVADACSARRELRVSPSIGYLAFFIPFVNLVVPYVAVRELALAGPVKRPKRAEMLLALWWSGFVAYVLVALIPLASDYEAPAMVVSAIRIVTALAAVQVVALIHNASAPFVVAESAP